MSQDYEIAYTTAIRVAEVVEVVQLETYVVPNLFGRVPIKELVKELESEWGRANGWQVVEAGRIYKRELGPVSLECHIVDERLGQVEFRRVISQMAWSDEAATVEQKLHAQIKAVQLPLQLAMNEVIARALVNALPVVAKELNFVANDVQLHVKPEEHVYELVMTFNN